MGCHRNTPNIAGVAGYLAQRIGRHLIPSSLLKGREMSDFDIGGLELSRPT